MCVETSENILHILLLDFRLYIMSNGNISKRNCLYNNCPKMNHAYN